MKNRLFALALILAMIPRIITAASREAQWKQVDEAIQKGLPKTAIEALEPIIQGALKDKAWGEAAKAMARKIVLEGNIQGNKPEEKITRLEAEIAKAPKEMAPLLEAIEANWFWHYFQQNRWRFMRRTATAQAPGKDFTTWDLPRLFAEIDRHFQRALAAPAQLQATPVSAFNDLLLQGTMPDAYRPTLYDFLAHEALKFYTSGEQAAARPQDAFEVAAASPIFAPAEQFLAWKVETTDTDSPAFKAIRLYQDLLKFHQNDKAPGAFLDADLARLAFGHNLAFGEEKNARYKAALKTFVDKWADHELSALALEHWARALQQQEDDWVEARRLALRGAKAFPDSVGGKLCHNLVAAIQARSIQITTERVWNCGPDGRAAAKPSAGPAIQVRYRNLTQVYFRTVAYDWETFLDRRHNRPENLNDRERRELLAKAPALEWSGKLPATEDFQERTETLSAPDTLKPGFYFLIASAKPNFGEADNEVTFTDIWVSDLALVVRPRDGNLEGFVLEADSGEPVPGAEIMAWHLDNQGNRIAIPKLATDENGFFSIAFQPNRQRGYLLRARHDGRELASHQEYGTYRSERNRVFDQTIFFTDRALYRPGQTIQYKGICLRADQEQDKYDLIAGRALTVVFADPNDKEIARQQQRCNDYGSFAGSFTAPRERVMGSMRIYVSGGPEGETRFNVEEYKRPKFQVTLDAPKTAARLNDKVSLQGHALSYTGAAVDGAQVKYRIVREVRMPYWWGWYYWRPSRHQGSQEIAHGVATTDAGGSFPIEFLAKPDVSVSEKDEPTFVFRIFADVTDGAGETRSADRSINLGYAALQAGLSADAWQTEARPVELNLATTTLDGEPQQAEGSLKIYRLKEPSRVQRPPLAGPEYWRGEGTGREADLSEPNYWPLGEMVAEKGFTTDAEGKATFQFKLSAGAYRAMLETQDRFGKKVTARLPFQVLNPEATRLAIKIPHLLEFPAQSVEPGQEFTALWGTGYDTGRAFIEIEYRHKMIQRYWTKPGQTQQQIKQAVTEAMRGGFTLHVTQVRENRAYLDSRRIDVPWSNKDLTLTWEHFTSKLQPNQKETWTAVITPKSEGGRQPVSDSALRTPHSALKSVAEMVATLYDASLDAFLPHSWQQRFNCFRQDYSTAQPAFENVPKPFQWLKGQWESHSVAAEVTYRHFPEDLVASFWGYGWVRPRRGFQIERMNVTNAPPQFEEGEAVALAGAAPAPSLAPAAAPMGYFAKGAADPAVATKPTGAASEPPPAPKGPDLSQVTARKNLNETAFFFPQLIADSNGVVKLQFTMPEALTQWKFIGFAHDKQLRSGCLQDEAVTAKDLMVQPNPPRFLREGDVLEFTVKVSNQTAARQTGKVRLAFTEAMNGQSADAALGLAPALGVPPSGGKAGGGPAKAGTPNKAVLGLAPALGVPPSGGKAGRGPAKAGTPNTEIDFDIPAKESRSFSWRLTVPDGLGFLTYKAVASTGRVSDGEEGYLPVLSRRIFITESLPLPIRGPATKKFEFAKLIKSGKSDTLRHQGFTVQMVSNPSWYAVLALPYLMEYPHECSEQVFNRLYANALARSIANGDPKIRNVFDQWKNTPALDSPLEKNQDLKSVMIEETPWLRQAQNESQARRNVGILFDDNRLNYEIDRTLRKLTEMQLPDGAWPWFPGGRGNDYITLYITTGFGRLRHLGVDLNVAPAVRSLNRLDGWIDERYRWILAHSNKEENHLDPTIALYLYGRSFFLKDKPVAPRHKEAVDYFLGQARKYWLQLACRQSQAQLALALKRFNDSAIQRFNDSTPTDIMKSIKERSVTNEELGMFWRDLELSWWWYHAPIETQAQMIEAFDEVMGDAQAVEECKVWLLKQKQTQDWKTTKATADAVYALLLRGRDLLASDALVEVTVGGIDVTPKRTNLGVPLPKGERQGEIRNPQSAIRNPVEPGTGFYETRFPAADIRPRLGEITVRKVDQGVAWGSVHWQYLEDMSKVTPHEGTPLKLKKTIYTKTTTKKGPVLEPVQGALQVGDELVVRIELRSDRDMEYLHLKDQRGSGTEPVNVISRYKFQDGLGYYESTRDTASHFFIDYLPKGVYVFEYSTRIQHRGQYPTGVAEIQCMYAPEFNSHSESLTLVVK